MKLSPEEIKYVADLARIELSSAEVEKFQDELSEVIDYNAKKLAQVKRKVKSTSRRTFDLDQKDEVKIPLTQEEALEAAPEVEKGFFVVPKVLEEE
jgi:aspartyl-tRNA(Asn)/glutamyl-tRNA(Gln) amidotransferase subunit C